MTNDVNIDKLKKISLFQKIKDNHEALERLKEIMSVKHFKAGETIIEEEDTGNEMYILAAGTIRIMKKTLKGDTYTVVILSDDRNVFFGEQALMDSDKRSATVVADTDCQCYEIKKEDFDELGIREPLIGLFVTREIAKKISASLRQSNQNFISLFEALIQEIEREA